MWMWQGFGIEQEDYNLAVFSYNFEEDEYVLKREREVELKVSEELQARLIEPFY